MSKMEFRFNDGGRSRAGFSGTTGDCVVRAVAIATEQDYQTAYDALSEGCRTQRVGKRKIRKSSARNGVNTKRKWFRDYMTSIGWKWTPTMSIGSGCKVHLCAGELPMGRLIVAVSKHYCAVIDGIVHDIYDPQREVHCSRPLTAHEPIKPHEFTHGDGWAHSIQRRCVYGYWSKA